MDAEALLEHRDFLRGLAGRLVFAGEDAEDVVQDTWARAVAHPPKPGGGIRGWLATVARNVVREGRRKRLRRLAREALAGRDERTPSADEIRDREAVRARVIDAVLGLPEPSREVILLRFYEDLPPRTIAARLGVPVETVRTRQKRAMAKLRAELDRRHGGDRAAWTAALLPLLAAKGGWGAGTAAIVATTAAVLLAGAFLIGPGDPPPEPAPPKTADAGSLPAGIDPAAATDSGAGPSERERAATLAASRKPPPGGILVLDRGGRPAEARIRTSPETQVDVEKALRLGNTGTDGELTWDELSNQPRDFLWAEGRKGIAGPIPWKKEGVVVVLGEGRSITGTVRDRNGRPVPGALVSLGLPTNAKGQYRIPMRFPGTPYRVAAWVLGSPHPPTRDEGTEVVLAVEERYRTVDLVVVRPEAPEILAVVRGTTAWQARGDIEFLSGGRGPRARFVPSGTEARILLSASRLAGKRITVRASIPGSVPAESEVHVPETPQTVEALLTLATAPGSDRGLVVDSGGKPVEGAVIYEYDDRTSLHSQHDPTKTGPDGTFRIEPGMFGKHLFAARPGKDGSDWVLLEPGRTEIVLRLGTGGVVEGAVTDIESGVPVPGVPVHLALGEEETFPLVWETATDADGRYRFAGVPPGTFVLPFVPTTLRATATFDPRRLRDENGRAELVDEGWAAEIGEPGAVFERDLRALRNPGGEFRFRLRYPPGFADPEGVRVEHGYETAYTWGNRTTTLSPDGETGCIHLFLPKGTHDLLFLAGRLWASPGRITIAGDRPAEERALEMEPLPPVEIRLVGSDGHPVRKGGVRVCIRAESPSGTRHGAVPTDSRGHARAEDALPPPAGAGSGKEKILLWVEGGGLFAGSQNRPDLVLTREEYLARRKAAGKGTLIIDLPVRTGTTLAIPVIDPSNAPVAGVRVELLPKGAFADSTAVSDRSGVLHLELRDLQRAKIRAATPWMGELEIDDFLRERRGKDRESRALCVARRRTVTILCVDGAGEPLPKVEAGVAAWVWKSVEFRLNEARRTDAEGRLEIEVPDVPLTLSVKVEGRGGASVEMEPGVTEARVVLETVRKLLVEVIVPPEYREDRIYVGADPIDAKAHRGRLVERTAEGFRTELLLPGRAHRVYAHDWLRYWWGEVVETGRDEKVILRIEPRPTWTLAARILDPDGKPMAGSAVRLVFGAPIDGYEHTAVTDAEGVVRMEIPEGITGRLRAWVEGCLRSLPQDVEVEAPPDAPIDFRAVPGFRLQVSFIMPEGTDPKEWPELTIRKFGPDGTEQKAGWGGRGYTGNRKTVSFELRPEPCRFEFGIGGKTFRLEVPGHPIDPPVFDAR